MATYLRIAILLAFCAFLAESSVIQQLVKNGERVEVTVARGASALARNVDGKRQVVQFQGPDAGVFVENGKKIESSNYEVKADGTFVIKSVSNADIGTYEKEPNGPVKNGDSAVAGPQLNLVLDKE